MLPALTLCGLLLGGPVANPPASDLESLTRQLADDDARERRKAVIGLVELGSEEAWLHVLESLEDPLGQVADQAQLELVKLPEAMRGELFGKLGLKSKADSVPLRVAEALGRMPKAQPESDYVGALKHKDERVMRSLLWSVERLAERGALGIDQEEVTDAVRQIADRHKSATVRAHAMLALGDLEPSSAMALIAANAQAKAVELRAACAELIAHLPREDRVEAARALARDEAFVVRLRAYESLASMGDKPGMGALIESLAGEPRLRVAWRIVGLLRQNSGMKYGIDERSWTQWLQGLPDDWTSEEKHESVELGANDTVSFVGMRVVSDRVAFLIDFSGSMWEERSGKTRKQRVDVEMARVLSGLSKDVHFNIHPFASTPLRWEKELTAASPRNVKAAITYFEKCKARGTGDFWAAVLEAMADPDVDTLMVLGDGAPSGGRRWNMELVKDLFEHENRFHGLTLDVLLVDCSRWLSSQWETMSEKSGGRCIGVDI